MLSFYKNPLKLNVTLTNYCNETTKEMNRKLKDKYQSERIYLLENNEPNYNLFILLFLSISTISFYYYKTIK